MEAGAVHPRYTNESTHLPGSESSRTNERTIIDFLPHAARKWALESLEKGQLDNNFTEKEAQLLTLFRLWRIAAHEEAHAYVVTALGGTVVEKSVIPEGNSLGHTTFRPPHTSDAIALLIFYIATAAASEHGEEMVGEHDHRGCGGDRAQMSLYARLGERWTNGRWKASELLSAGKNKARVIISALSPSYLHDKAMNLAKSGKQ